MRLTPAKVVKGVMATVFTVICFMALRNTKDFTATCDMPEEYISELYELLYRTHDVLDQLRLTHFLCYGSLFGQVRHSETPSWERDGEFCVLNAELLQYDEVFLIRSFRKADLELTYDSSEGRYIVRTINPAPRIRQETPDEAIRPDTPEVQLIVFAADKEIKSSSFDEMLHRVGWKRRMLPPDCEYSQSLECFPKRLIDPPLELKPFGMKDLPVPHEDIEMLKYHFPDNWWIETKPLNC